MRCQCCSASWSAGGRARASLSTHGLSGGSRECKGRDAATPRGSAKTLRNHHWQRGAHVIIGVGAAPQQVLLALKLETTDPTSYSNWACHRPWSVTDQERVNHGAAAPMAECRALLPLPHCHPITFFETRAALCVTTSKLISDVRSTVHPPKTAMSVVFLHIATATPQRRPCALPRRLSRSCYT